MKAPIKWLNDYVEIDMAPKEYADAMTLSGSKVEGVEVQGDNFIDVVVGKIVSIEKHPDADKLRITKVDIGKEALQVVTGAPNIALGDYIPLAIPGAKLPGGKIKVSKLRGVESYGMMCSIEELELTKDQFPEAPDNGVYIFNGEPELGKSVKEVMGIDDTIVEFEITPNRPDCLCIEGLARESAVTLGKKFVKPEINFEETEDKVTDFASVEIADSDLCSRYIARVVKDVKIKESPKWMRDRLSAAGMRPINNLVDITNYVMLELGQPMHAFDLSRVLNGEIIVRRAKKDEKITTLDDQERILDEEMLVISDSEKAIAVAGVMGGANSEVIESTNMILLESATFNGASVRHTAKKLGLRSEASSRFEKGLDSKNALKAINRAAQLIDMLGAGSVMSEVIDCYPCKNEEKIIAFNPEKINRFLGTNIEESYMENLLEKLEFIVDKDNMLVTVPSFRLDVEGEADIAEEVARFYDYNNIQATLLEGKASTQGKKTYKQNIESIIHNTMLSSGLYETYTFSFTSPKVFDKLRVSENSDLRKTVNIMNPLGEDYSIMRTTTVPDMLGVISKNYSRNIDKGLFYELSTIYFPIEGEQITPAKEVQVLTMGMYGGNDFFDIKGIIEKLLIDLGIKNYKFERNQEGDIYHPGRAAKLFINGKAIGSLGEIHPVTAQNFKCPEKSYVAMIEIETLITESNLERTFVELPKYPAITRDISMPVKVEVMVENIEKCIKDNGGKLLESVNLFDVYQGKQVEEGTKSIAYSLSFRAKDRTLTDEDVNKAMDKILKSLEKDFHTQLRS